MTGGSAALLSRLPRLGSGALRAMLGSGCAVARRRARRSTWRWMFGDNGHGALGGRVLVVEDDVDLREVMAGALAGDGHHVVEAADGRAALDALAAQTFD